MKVVIFVLSFFFYPLYSHAAGKILLVKGKVEINGKPVKKGQSFSKGEVIKTHHNALVILKFDSGSTIKLNEDSKLKVVIDKPGEKKSAFSLLEGSSFFKKHFKGEGRLSVKASKVSMGVRGTEFFVSFGSQKKEDVYMCVREGLVAIKGERQKKITLVKAGEGVVVPDGKESSKPKPLPWTKNLNWDLDPKSKELENKAKIEESYSDPLERDYD